MLTPLIDAATRHGMELSVLCAVGPSDEENPMWTLGYYPPRTPEQFVHKIFGWMKENRDKIDDFIAGGEEPQNVYLLNDADNKVYHIFFARYSDLPQK